MIKIKMFILVLIGFFYGNILNNFFSEIISMIDTKVINKNKKRIVTIHYRPNYNFLFNANISESYYEHGIVLQGPVIIKNDFTLNTLKLYCSMFPNAEIILSTWEIRNTEFIKEIQKLPVKTLINNKPSYSGIRNVNYQIFSTHSAIENFTSSVKFILKTRTDTRIYSKNALSDLKNLIELYSSNRKTISYRIIGIDFNTPKYIPYNFSDVMQFGHRTDIELYWSVSLQNKVDANTKNKFFQHNVFESYYHNPNPEIYLLKNYLDKKNIPHDNSIYTYYKILRDYFIVIDKEMINFYWYKYSIDEYRKYNYNSNDKYETLRHLDWLRIINNKLPTNFKESNFKNT